MKYVNPDNEAETILEILAQNPGLQLKEIHSHLVDTTNSKFIHSPSHGEGYNLERYIVKGLVEYLNVKQGWITSDEGKWSITETGRQQIP